MRSRIGHRLIVRRPVTEAPIDITDERHLLAAARAGDAHAFGRLVDRHRPGLELYCCLMLGCPQKAEDVVQETVLRAWRGLEPVDQSASARIWLYRIATHACFDELGAADEFPRSRSSDL
jgi:RNA polymerase sigma-70 factor (ECF subfamily)